MLIQRISKSGLPVETSNIFTGTFNAPTIGVYDFGVAGNTDQLVLNLNPNYFYMIDQLSLSATVDEGVYLRSLNVNPFARLRLRSQPTFLYPFPIPAINYKDGINFNYFFNTMQSNDALLMTLDGVLNQVAETVGVPTISILISFVIYIETNTDNVKVLRENTAKSTVCFNS